MREGQSPRVLNVGDRLRTPDAILEPGRATLRMRTIASHVTRYATYMQVRLCSRGLAYRGQPCTWSRMLHMLQTIRVKPWGSVRPSKQDSTSQRNSILSAGSDLLVAIDDVKESLHSLPPPRPALSPHRHVPLRAFKINKGSSGNLHILWLYMRSNSSNFRLGPWAEGYGGGVAVGSHRSIFKQG